MISASKSSLSLKNPNILRPKVTINLTNLRKKFFESQPWGLTMLNRNLCERFCDTIEAPMQ